MPENKDDHLCPVRSFQKYLAHLHPDNDFLWQTPLEKVNPAAPDIWFGRQHVGKNTLGHFMNDISLHCQLSKIYTNHSIRVTGATVLTQMNFSSSEIMSITGHKSVQSLTRYQKTKDRQKIAMGNVMHQSLIMPEDNIVVGERKEIQGNRLKRGIEYQNVRVDIRALVTPQQILPEKENVSDKIVPFDSNMEFGDVPDLDLLQMITQVEAEEEKKNKQVTPTTTTMTAMLSSNILNNVPKSLFHNCTIQNVTFNMAK